MAFSPIVRLPIIKFYDLTSNNFFFWFIGPDFVDAGLMIITMQRRTYTGAESLIGMAKTTIFHLIFFK